MKTVLTISDSVEGTKLDLMRSSSTIKAYGLDPLAAAPRISFKDGSVSVNDISELLDYVFSECDFASLMAGYIADHKVIKKIADELASKRRGNVLCCPSLISDDGQILADYETYEALTLRLFPLASCLAINILEAETLSGMPLSDLKDLREAASKISAGYGCAVFIKGSKRTLGYGTSCDNGMCEDIPPVSFDEERAGAYSFPAALACEFALGKSLNSAIRSAYDFMSGENKVNKASRDSFTHVTSSLVTPGKSIRDIAREIAPPVKTEDIKPAVTSAIDKPVTKLQIPELKALRERLDNISRLADSGK